MLDRRFSDEPFANREFIVNEPLRDLNSESCSPRPELEDSEPARDLTNIVCSAKPAVEPIDVLKFTPRPLKRDDASPMVSDRDLNSEVCSTRLEAEPKEPDTDLANP